MDDVGNECILEVFDFFKKNVYCCSVNEKRLNGLINRGAVVWVDDANKTKILAMETYLSFKDNINLPDADYGWSDRRSYSFGQDTLVAIVNVVDNLR